MVAGLSIQLFDKQAHRERTPGTSKQLGWPTSGATGTTPRPAPSSAKFSSPGN